MGRKTHKPKTEVNLKQVSISLGTKETGIGNSVIGSLGRNKDDIARKSCD